MNCAYYYELFDGEQMITVGSVFTLASANELLQLALSPVGQEAGHTAIAENYVVRKFKPGTLVRYTRNVISTHTWNETTASFE